MKANEPAVDADGQYSIELSINKQDIPATVGSITFTYSRDVLKLTSADGKTEITPDKPVGENLPNGQTQLRFKALALQHSGERASLDITVRCGDAKPARCQVQVSLPTPDVVWLEAYRREGKLDGSSEARLEAKSELDSQSVSPSNRLAPQVLRPFPNRPTTYTFKMVNQSGLPKKLLVRTYLLQASYWNSDHELNCQEAWQRLASSATPLPEESPVVELADFDKPKELKFPAVKPPAKKPDEKPSEKPPAADAAKAKLAVPAGLAMVVFDAKSKDATEPKWIQTFIFAPCGPPTMWTRRPRTSPPAAI